MSDPATGVAALAPWFRDIGPGDAVTTAPDQFPGDPDEEVFLCRAAPVPYGACGQAAVYPVRTMRLTTRGEPRA